MTDACAQSAPETVAVTAQAALPAGNAPNGKTADDWHFGATFYGWATSLSGSATARGNPVDFNASIIDIFQKSDSVLAWDSYFEAAKGRFAAYLDVVWSKAQVPKSAASYANPIGGLSLSSQASGAVTSSLTIIEGGAFYEIVRWPGSDGAVTAVDGFGSRRYWNISAHRHPRKRLVLVAARRRVQLHVAVQRLCDRGTRRISRPVHERGLQRRHPRRRGLQPAGSRPACGRHRKALNIVYPTDLDPR